MKILVLNSGSSSMKSRLYDTVKKEFICSCLVDRIGLSNSKIIFDQNSKKNNSNKEIKIQIKDHESALKNIFNILLKNNLITSLTDIKAIGHRVVHGGKFFSSSVLIDNKVISKIKESSILAPLHNPNNLKGILVCKKLLPKAKQVAVFDTSFHQTMPESSYTYAIPEKLSKKYSIRRYGFHGTSYRYIIKSLKQIDSKLKNIIICHLGNGSSIAAVKSGKSIDTSMGFTPLEGLVMGTRSGDMDPSILPFLGEHEKLSFSEIDHILNKNSGLKGISGFSDMRDIWNTYNSLKLKKSKTKKESELLNKLKLAMDLFSYRIRKYVGSYTFALGKLDAIVFTGGIGKNAYYLREQILSGLKDFNIILDKKRNKKNLEMISSSKSKVKIFTLETNEELMIVEDVLGILKQKCKK